MSIEISLTDCDCFDYDEINKSSDVSLNMPFLPTSIHEAIPKLGDNRLVPLEQTVVREYVLTDIESKILRVVCGVTRGSGQETPPMGKVSAEAGVTYKWGDEDDSGVSGYVSGSVSDDNGNKAEVEVEINEDGSGSATVSVTHDEDSDS